MHGDLHGPGLQVANILFTPISWNSKALSNCERICNNTVCIHKETQRTQVLVSPSKFYLPGSYIPIYPAQTFA